MTQPEKELTLKELPERWTPRQPVLFRQLSSHGRYRFIERSFDEDAQEFVEREVSDDHGRAIVWPPEVPSDMELEFTFSLLSMAADAPKGESL